VVDWRTGSDRVSSTDNKLPEYTNELALPYGLGHIECGVTEFWKFGRSARLCHVFVSSTSDLCSEQMQLMTSAHLMPTVLPRLLRILSRIFHRSMIHPEHMQRQAGSET